MVISTLVAPDYNVVDGPTASVIDIHSEARTGREGHTLVPGHVMVLSWANDVVILTLGPDMDL